MEQVEQQTAAYDAAQKVQERQGKDNSVVGRSNTRASSSSSSVCKSSFSLVFPSYTPLCLRLSNIIIVLQHMPVWSLKSYKTVEQRAKMYPWINLLLYLIQSSRPILIISVSAASKMMMMMTTMMWSLPMQKQWIYEIQSPIWELKSQQEEWNASTRRDLTCKPIWSSPKHPVCGVVPVVTRRSQSRIFSSTRDSIEFLRQPMRVSLKYECLTMVDSNPFTKEHVQRTGNRLLRIQTSQQLMERANKQSFNWMMTSLNWINLDQRSA